MAKFKHIIWDWNGTLLDDLHQNMQVTNLMLTRRGLPLLDSVEKYHSLFGFPVINFYYKMGYTFENETFQDIAREYNEEMDYLFSETDIFEDAEPTLRAFKHAGLNQLIVSQLEIRTLEQQATEREIDHFFTEILGTRDIYVKSKVDIALGWQRRIGAIWKEILFIGDTSHDIETARALGCECVLVPRGHASKKELETTGCRVFDNLDEVRKYVLDE